MAPPPSGSDPRRRYLWYLAWSAVFATLAAVGGVLLWSDHRGRADDAADAYVPRDPALRGQGLRFYVAAGARPPRAVLFFFGNDLGFWRPHRRLAGDLASQGYAVAGWDMRPLLRSLPDARRQRDSVFRARIVPLVSRAARELAGPGRAPGAPGGVPLVFVGHSLGAEVALWTAAYARIPGTAGVVALSPGLRSHLRVSVADLLMTGEPTGPGSFSVPEAVAAAVGRPGPPQRVAVVRGERDRLRYADSALAAAGGPWLRRFDLRFAGHSLKRIALARFVVRSAVRWVLEGPDTGSRSLGAAASSSARPSVSRGRRCRRSSRSWASWPARCPGQRASCPARG